MKPQLYYVINTYSHLTGAFYSPHGQTDTHDYRLCDGNMRFLPPAVGPLRKYVLFCPATNYMSLWIANNSLFMIWCVFTSQRNLCMCAYFFAFLSAWIESRSAKRIKLYTTIFCSVNHTAVRVFHFPTLHTAQSDPKCMYMFNNEINNCDNRIIKSNVSGLFKISLHFGMQKISRLIIEPSHFISKISLLILTLFNIWN